MPNLALSPTYTDGPALFAATAQRGMEGVVAKRGDGVYRPGTRSPGWVKATHRSVQACVVGGWRPENVGTARVSATRVGALLLGVPTPDGLRFAGRVGSGLASEVAQRALRGRLVDADRSPFTERVPRPDEKGARWCEPEIVVEVSHMGWTDAGKLRAPVYRGVRDDLRPDDVRQERLSRRIVPRCEVMDFNEMAGKAQQYAAEHPEQVEGAGEKAGEFGKERFAGHDEQIDQGVDKFKDWVPGGEGGEDQPPAEPPA